MKKLLIASAIAASMASGAQAASYDVSSNVTDIQLWLGFGNTNAVTTQTITIGGTAEDSNDDGVLDSTALTFGGQVLFDAAGVDVQVTFAMTDGTLGADGTTYTGGNIIVHTDAHDGLGFVLFDTIDVAANNIPMLASIGGGAAVPGAQNTAGLNVDIGTTALPGLWNGQFGGAGFNSGVAAVTLLGNTAGMYLAGDVTLTETSEVPVPAAAWLFGSALVGLAGVGRKRKMA